MKSSDPGATALGEDGALHLSLGRIGLQSGAVLDDAVMVVKTFGDLNARRDNAVVIPTSFGASHRDFEWMVGRESLFDPMHHFVVIANLFGNGLSSSPSNSAAFAAGGRFPLVTAYDNALAQKYVLERFFGIRRIAVAMGWSMGGQVAWHLASLFPNDVAHLIAVCATAKTSAHNHVFLEGARAVLQTDSAYDAEAGRFVRAPERALPALGRFYAGWALSHAFYRSECWRSLGCDSLEGFLKGYWETAFAEKHADDLLSHIATWQAADIAANERHRGDLGKAIEAVRARVLLLPAGSDLYFREADVRAEATHLGDVQIATLESPWGHRAGNPVKSPSDRDFIRARVRDFISC
ncbi:alpha/beta fold hydrolase [Nitratireductor pacificus]|uniref:alpha/beta fold hydrolase n=1 Tax=Nitratireductor pacificus TaxID=1231180 RepID=UPI0002FAE392|nr:alpha/beta fold hydrolase [Nitratireductor pacificus]